MAWFSALLQSLPFAHSIMLLWGVAAAVPIIIHLWSKRQYSQVTWAAMEYLIAAMRKNARRIRIEQLLLLLLRVAILLLLAIALADPTWSSFPSLGTSMGGGGDTHFVLVLDASYSMAYQPEEKSRFDLAREMAKQIVEDSRQGDGFTLILMADPPQVVIEEPAYDPQDVIEEIDSLALQHGGADLIATLGEIQDVVKNSRRSHPRLKKVNVCVFTDLGRTTWEQAESPACRDMIARAAESARLVLFDVGQLGVGNAVISQLKVQDPLPTVGRAVTIESEYQCFGPPPTTARQIAFLVDHQQIRSEAITLSDGARSTISFSHRFETAGQHEIELVLESDSLPIDNHRWLSLPVRESIRVLCLQGRQNAAKYVAYALQPQRTDRPRVQTELRFEDALLEEDLNEFDAIFLCNVGQFTREEAAVLHDYVRRGGGLMIALGDQVQAESYREHLCGKDGAGRVLPVELLDVSPDGEYFFDPLEYRHPIVAPFARHERSGLLTTPIWRYFETASIESSAAQVALAYTNGDAAIVEERIGQGRTILLTTAASPDSLDRSVSPPQPWTALPVWPSFPPLVQEMLSLAIQGRSDRLNVMVGDTVTGTVPGATDVPVTVRLPSGESERVLLQVDGDDSRWDFDHTWLSGFYTVQFGTPPKVTQNFAVNVDPRESNLERIDPELLPSQFQQKLQHDGDTASPPSTRPTQYFRYFLAAVLVLVLLETFLAWRFGHGNAT